MGMGPKIKTVDRKNQASQLGGDYLQTLQGMLSQGALGTGVGPLQRQAGTAAQQYVNSLQNRVSQGVNTASLVQNNTPRLIDALSAISARDTNRNVADLREGFGARFGSGLMQQEGRTRNDAQMNLEQILANVLVGQGDREQAARQFDVQAGMGLNDQLLAGIGQLFGQGQANLDPFNQFAMRGILDPEVIATPGLGSQLLQGGLGFLGTYLGAGGKIPGIGGGGLSANAGKTGQIASYPGSGQRQGGGFLGPITPIDPSTGLPIPMWSPGAHF